MNTDGNQKWWVWATVQFSEQHLPFVRINMSSSALCSHICYKISTYNYRYIHIYICIGLPHFSLCYKYIYIYIDGSYQYIDTNPPPLRTENLQQHPLCMHSTQSGKMVAPIFRHPSLFLGWVGRRGGKRMCIGWS